MIITIIVFYQPPNSRFFIARYELAMWPRSSDAELARVVKVVSAAVSRWGGGWGITMDEPWRYKPLPSGELT